MLNCPKCGAALGLELALDGPEPAPSRTDLRGEAREVLREMNPAAYQTSGNGRPVRSQPKATSDLGTLLMHIDDNTVDTYERQFVQETRERFRKYGAGTRMSEKQLSWLRRIAEKYAA